MKAHHDNCITLFENFLNQDLHRLEEDYMQLETDLDRLCDYLSCCYNLPEDHEIYKLVEDIESSIASDQWDAVELATKDLILQLIDFAG